MRGFFRPSAIATAAKKQHRRVLGCGACLLNKACTTPCMEAFGTGENKVMVILPWPSARSDSRGKHLQAAEERDIFDALEARGLVAAECRFVYAIACFPGEEEPSPKQIGFCRPQLLKEIEKYKPRLILPFGAAAIEGLIGHRWELTEEVGTIRKWRGWNIPDQDLRAWVCPQLYPNEFDDNMTGRVSRVIFDQDMDRALEHHDLTVPDYSGDKDRIKILLDEIEIDTVLEKLVLDPPLLSAFDYEGTGLKPYRKGHKIVSCSIYDGTFCYAFPVYKANYPWLRKYIGSEDPKVGANWSFENRWSLHCLGVPARGCVLDLLLAQHVRDNRQGICSVKFQTYVYKGVIDYNSHIDPYLKATEEEEDEHGTNGFNRILECDIEDILEYNGFDSIHEYDIAVMHMKYMGFTRNQWLEHMGVGRAPHFMDMGIRKSKRRA